uniref:Galectin n=1 Tax=Glossina brevipalpis TaxID=37001 RepID=A0A1A9W0J4_9MUSC
MNWLRLLLYWGSDDTQELIYRNQHLMHLSEGSSFTVSGFTQSYCQGFSINFIIENVTRDVALHVSPRLPQNYIIRNSKIQFVWGVEENASALLANLKRGRAFSIQILFTKESILISVNGYHFCKFTHRLPYHDIRSLEIRGHVERIKVERAMVESYPDRLPHSVPLPIPLTKSLKSIYDFDRNFDEEDDNYARNLRKIFTPTHASLALMMKNEISMPYYGTFPSGILQLGRIIKIDGRIKLLPQSFLVNIQIGCKVWPLPTVGLHINVRFAKQLAGIVGRTTVVRNTYTNGAWDKDRRLNVDTEFRPGKAFTILIACTQAFMRVYVNHRVLVKNANAIDPNLLDTVYIQGDIKLWNVVLVAESYLPPKTKWGVLSSSISFISRRKPRAKSI